MADYSGFAALGDLVAGGPSQRAQANEQTYLTQGANAYKAIDEAAMKRRQRIAGDALSAAIANDPSFAGHVPLAQSVLGMAPGQPNLDTYAKGAGQLNTNALGEIAGTMAQDPKADPATLARIISVVAHKPIEETKVGPAGAFDPYAAPLGNTVIPTDLTKANIGALGALSDERHAAAGNQGAQAHLHDVQASVGGFNPNTGKGAHAGAGAKVHYPPVHLINSFLGGVDETGAATKPPPEKVRNFYLFADDHPELSPPQALAQFDEYTKAHGPYKPTAHSVVEIAPGTDPATAAGMTALGDLPPDATEADALAAFAQGAGGSKGSKVEIQPKGGHVSAPYSEGTKLHGPGGKLYVVKNGVPVPAE